ncbi:hypothetical protein BDN72DRAFT_843133 [Pluteus cervinus]|uniref:Uncharacterized protein n=1 Tax=Pluteus cervinus TaxID=181527 RepID=A0ACD3AR34_9AGAR|nr:hypothetical protein BDN72DRAFT_843133 [Pluteus cervinus]
MSMIFIGTAMASFERDHDSACALASFIVMVVDGYDGVLAGSKHAMYSACAVASFIVTRIGI